MALLYFNQGGHHLMWPLYFLLNKILKIDEEDEEEKDGDHMMNVTAGCCSFELPSDNRIGREAMLHKSHFVQVSVLGY